MTRRKTAARVPGRKTADGKREIDIAAIAELAGLGVAARLFPDDVAAAYSNAMASRAGLDRTLPPALEPFSGQSPSHKRSGMSDLA